MKIQKRILPYLIRINRVPSYFLENVKPIIGSKIAKCIIVSNCFLIFAHAPLFSIE